MPLKGEAKRAYRRRYYIANRDAILARTKAYALAHPETMRRSYINRTLQDHELTQAEYDQKLHDQNFVCAICSKTDDRRLSIDHDHTCCPTGRSCRKCTRGLLCNVCNKKLEVVEDISFFEAANQYLLKYK